MNKDVFGNLAFGFIIFLLIVLAAYGTFAQDYGQAVANPYGAPVAVKPATNTSDIKIEDKKDTIETPQSASDNPTGGQVTNEQFDKLINTSR